MQESEELERLLLLLSSTPAEQEKYLRGLGTWPLLDELGLEVSDFVQSVSFRKLLASPRSAVSAAASALRGIDSILAANSGRGFEHLWAPAALGDGFWEEIRSAASMAVARLKGPPPPLNP